MAMAMPPPSAGPLVDLTTTYGSILIGVIFSAGLVGIIVTQAWSYYRSFPKDAYYLKLIVAYVLIVEASRLAFAIHGVYYYVVAEWGNPLALANLIWSSQEMEVVVRLYFVYRVWIMSRHNWFLVLLLFLLALANLAIGIGTWIFSLQDTKVTDHTPLLHTFGTAGLSLGLTADWMISLSLIYFLLQNRSGMQQTNSIINYIIFYTINMGLITSSTDIVVLVLSLWKSPAPTLYFLAIYQVLGNLYAFSLLASLNSRTKTREALENHSGLSDYSTFAATPNDVGSSTADASRTQDSLGIAPTAISLKSGSYNETNGKNAEKV